MWVVSLVLAAQLHGLQEPPDLTDNLLRAIPDARERLASGDPSAYTRLFLDGISQEGTKRRYPSLVAGDLDSLVGPAIGGAGRDLADVCSAIVAWNLRSAIPTLTGRLEAKRDSGLRDILDCLTALRVPEAAEPIRRHLEAHVGCRLEFRALRAINAALGPEGAADYNAAYIDHPFKSVREGAAGWLSLSGSREHWPVFQEWFRKNVRNARGRGYLVEFPLDQSWPVILELLEDEDPLVRQVGLGQLGYIKSRKAVSRLRRLLASDNPVVVIGATGVLAKLHDQDSIPRVRPLLHSQDPDVRLKAAKALAILGSEASLPLLLKLLAAGDREAPFHLGRLRLKKAIPALLSSLDEPEGNLNTNVIFTLGTLEAREVIPRLQLLLEEGTVPEVRASIYSLWKLNDRTSIPRIRQRLDHTNPDVRAAAASVLGAWQVKEAIPDILPLINDRGQFVDEQALRALGWMGDTSVVATLIEELDRHKRPWLVIEALDALEDDRALPQMRALLTHRMISVRVAAAEWLVHRGHREGVEVLLRDSWKLGALNALRRPEAWKRLRSTRLKERMTGPILKILPRLAKKAGLEVEWPLEDEFWMFHWRTLHSEVHTYSLWSGMALMTSRASGPILESDRIRCLSREDARAFWSAWWAGEQEKQSNK